MSERLGISKFSSRDGNNIQLRLTNIMNLTRERDGARDVSGSDENVIRFYVL